MTYDQTRDLEQLRRLKIAIDEFIFRYKLNPSTVNRKTIILFPGGIGSHLLRADTSYQNGPPFFYDTVWLDCSIFLGAALNLAMNGDIDTDNRIVIADGFVEFDAFNIKPYNGFIQWCEQNHFDWFVYGWDWRRRLDEIVDFFLNTFLPTFQQRVVSACGVDPLQYFALVGHSFGGMVIKLVLNRGGNLVDKMQRAITVATPFYGYAGQVHRYFKGDPDVNFEGVARITRAVSSMRGGYTLLFLDENTYNRDRIALQNDPYPLVSYPSVDAANNNVVADPYNPQNNNMLVRYPQNYGFDLAELAYARAIYQQVADPLNNVVNQKFYNIRGIQATNQAILNSTINSQTWDWIQPNFNPDQDPDPIVDATVCPGDGVVPAWSARLVSTPVGNIKNLLGDIEHMTMMNSGQVQNAIAAIL